MRRKTKKRGDEMQNKKRGDKMREEKKLRNEMRDIKKWGDKT